MTPDQIGHRGVEPAQRRVREERLEKANQLIEVIGGHGRRFFCQRGVLCWLYQDKRGRIWFVDSWRGEEVYTHYRGTWRKFASGGTMRRLIEALRNYVMSGMILHEKHFWFPEWICDGDLWGYGSEMGAVREAAIRLGLVHHAQSESGMGDNDVLNTK